MDRIYNHHTSDDIRQTHSYINIMKISTLLSVTEKPLIPTRLYATYHSKDLPNTRTMTTTEWTEYKRTRPVEKGKGRRGEGEEEEEERERDEARTFVVIMSTFMTTMWTGGSLHQQCHIILLTLINNSDLLSSAWIEPVRVKGLRIIPVVGIMVIGIEFNREHSSLGNLVTRELKGITWRLPVCTNSRRIKPQHLLENLHLWRLSKHNILNCGIVLLWKHCLSIIEKLGVA